MMRLAIVCLLLTACQCDDDSAVPLLPSAGAPTRGGTGFGEDVDLQPKSVYKKAYDQARKEVTPQNAGARLDQLDGQIEHEKEMMR